MLIVFIALGVLFGLLLFGNRHTPLNMTRFRENISDNSKLYSAVETV